MCLPTWSIPGCPPIALSRPMPSNTASLGWLVAEVWDHLWPWSVKAWSAPTGPSGWFVAGTGRHGGLDTPAATGRLQSSAIIGWWFGWSVYGSSCAWGGQALQKMALGGSGTAASPVSWDMICYVGFKNLLIGATLFLTLKSLGWMVV